MIYQLKKNVSQLDAKKFGKLINLYYIYTLGFSRKLLGCYPCDPCDAPLTSY